MEVHTNVAESDIGRLKPGMRVSFTVDAYPGEPFRGSIRDIRNAPQVVQNVVTYDAVIDVDNPDLKLKPGMTATVSIVTDRRRDVLAVPNTALRFRPEGARRRRGAGDQRHGAGGRRPASRGEGTGVARGTANRRWRRRRRRAAVVKRTVYVLVDGKPRAARSHHRPHRWPRDGSHRRRTQGRRGRHRRRRRPERARVSAAGSSSAAREFSSSRAHGPHRTAQSRQDLPVRRHGVRRAARREPRPSSAASSWRSPVRRVRASRR